MGDCGHGETLSHQHRGVDDSWFVWGIVVVGWFVWGITVIGRFVWGITVVGQCVQGIVVVGLFMWGITVVGGWAVQGLDILGPGSRSW